MNENINYNSLIQKFISELETAINETQVIEKRNNFIKNIINPLYAKINSAEIVDKSSYGKGLNDFKNQIIEIATNKINEFSQKSNTSSSDKSYDLTIDSSKLSKGALNPITIVTQQICEYFKKLNFDIKTNEEVTKVKYNFDNLNVPKFHPTRNTSESFYISNDTMLTVQNTAMTAIFIENNQNPDIRVAAYGYVYRNDDDDASHSHQFNQLDFVWIKKGINVKNLKWLISGFIKHVFGEDTKSRFRISNFPFTEPSFEVDASCPFCGGVGCSTCKNSGWIELLGAGILNQQVLDAANISGKTGIAAGLGLDRIAMLKFGISDIRNLYSNDFRTLNQFKNERNK